MTKTLSKNPNASTWLIRAQGVETAKHILGDPNDFANNSIRNLVAMSLNQLRSYAACVLELPNDATRTVVSQNNGARKVAENMRSNLISAKNKLTGIGEKLHSDGYAKAYEKFTLTQDGGTLDASYLAWARDQFASGKGMEVKEAALGNARLAAVIWNAPPAVLGISTEVNGNLCMYLIERHVPDGFAEIIESAGVNDLTEKFANAISAVNEYSYDPVELQKMGSRVELFEV